jgi:hypothetical protein
MRSIEEQLVIVVFLLGAISGLVFSIALCLWLNRIEDKKGVNRRAI